MKILMSLMAATAIAVTSMPVAAVAAPKAASSQPARAAQRPNVIIIYADDLGFADISSFGNKLIRTSQIDSIAEQGARFNNAYTSAPLCSPSRAGMLTGRYQQKFGFEEQVSSGAYPKKDIVPNNGHSWTLIDKNLEGYEDRGIPLAEQSLAEVLKASGYATGIVGKWHLGHLPKYQPQNRGFDYSMVFYSNTSLQYLDIDDPNMVSKMVDIHDAYPLVAWTRDGLNGIRENGKKIEVENYLLWEFRDRAIDFIKANKDKPFFLYWPINSPVPPLQVPRSYYDKLGSIENENKRAYEAFMLATDDAVGAVLAALKEQGIDDNTIVIFASDNGAAETRPGDNGPFSGGKFNVKEGGIRTPLMLRWPSRVKGGTVVEGVTSTLDIYPTILAAAGIKAPAGKSLDGVDLLPFINGKKRGQPHDTLYWKLGSQQAMRKDNWKLYMDLSKKVYALYDLDADIGEMHDLSQIRPEIFQDMMKRYESWKNALPAPLWHN